MNRAFSLLALVILGSMAACVPETETDDEEACIEECGENCVAPDSQPCASDGRTYCSTCVIACKDLEVVDDAECQ